ncbi:MAG: hypothetical protein IJS01_13000 [Lentisphaeria bacterium]|nr:hypothetical protein [Lentisphaeria bacterium]
MKISWFKKVISPDVGAELAGYGPHDVSVTKLDDLYATGLLMDDGEKKVLLVSFDLLGLDASFIRGIRKFYAASLGMEENAVMLTCTHTHTGPHSRTINEGRKNILNVPYLERLEKVLRDSVKDLADPRPCEAFYYSAYCDENRNRRYVTADNRGSFTPHRREVISICEATHFADKELGMVFFFDPKTGNPLYGIGNFAAHPLAGHAPGIGGLRISADYPGAFRDYVLAETGAEAMFITGAAGDMVPKEDELGSDAIRSMGVRLGKAFIGGMIDAQRNPGRFHIAEPKLGSTSRIFRVPFREQFRRNPELLPESYLGSDCSELEIQCVSIGDVCFVGVPGELCSELGQEIKWHSPFRRTFIAYNSTAYFSYMCPANFLVQGGYEANNQRFAAEGGLVLLNTAWEAMRELRESVFPSAGEKYPDGNFGPVVNIPPNR